MTVGSCSDSKGGTVELVLGQVLCGGVTCLGGVGELGSGVVVLVGEDVGECAHGGVGEIAAFTVLPFLVLFEEDCADKAVCGLTVGEDLDDVGAALDFAVEPLDGGVGPDLLPVLSREGREGGEVGLGVDAHLGDLGEGKGQGVGDRPVLGGDGPCAWSERRSWRSGRSRAWSGLIRDAG